ncbi:MAG TPA: hypothetical protein VG621_03080 [Candidatus Paceibacterota bacterium]|nr:hypothetical protein [Candidatus Paceibacterota bacterium]
MKENLEQILNINEVENIQAVFSKQLELEKLPLFKDILQSIKDYFEQAKDSNEKEVIQNSLHWIEVHENYLGEKYRDAKEERDYMKAVRAAIAYLKNKLK